MTAETGLYITAIIGLILCSGYFSGSEAALFSLPTTRLKTYQQDPDPRRRLIAQLLMHPRDLLVTVFILNTLVNILLQNTASNLFGETASWGLKVGVPLVLTLLFGEIIPKYIGLQHNVTFAYWVAPAIYFIQNFLKPIRQATIAITTPISRLMFFFLKKEPKISKEEIQHILDASEKHGIFNADEGELVEGYLKMQDAVVKELMWPKEDILFYDINDPLTKLTYLMVDQECSRLPVCNPNLDNVLGIISAKQFFLHKDELRSPQDLLPFLTKPFYVPESTSARLLMRRFNEQNQILALVVDEYGSITGIITREDLNEVVIGDITDLRDQNSLYTKPGKNEIITSGKLELDEFNEIFSAQLQSPNNMITIGGWLIERLGEIPKSGSKYELEGFLFQVLASTPNRIRRLYVRKLSKSEKK
jgi:putative hemolysin